MARSFSQTLRRSPRGPLPLTVLRRLLAASDVLCRACFNGLPFVGRPLCGRCGTLTGFLNVFRCDECRDKDFLRGRGLPYGMRGGEGVRTHSQVRGLPPVVEKIMAPLLAGVLGASRCRCTARAWQRFQPDRAYEQRGSGEDRGALFG